MAAPGVIRRLSAVERDKVRDHLLRLDPEDRLLRFGGQVSDAHIEAYCAGLDWRRGVVLGWLDGGDVRALAELKPIADASPRAAEAALSVEKPFQDRGIGTELLRRLIVIARNRSIRSLYTLCALENGKVLRMTRKLGATLTFDQGEVAARVPLPWPNQVTLLLELLDDAGAVLAMLRPGEPAGAGSAAELQGVLPGSGDRRRGPPRRPQENARPHQRSAPFTSAEASSRARD